MFPCDGEEVALAGIEGHLPVLFPFFKLLRIFLEDAGVSLGENLPVKDGVVGEQPHRGLGALAQVVDVYDKYYGAKYGALRDTRGDLVYSRRPSLNNDLLGSVC